MNRRDFFQSNAIAEAAGQMLAAADVLSRQVDETVASPVSLLHYGRRAMATHFEMLLPLATPMAGEAAASGLDEIDRLEELLSAYRESSEVCRINREAHIAPLAIDPDLFALLMQSARINKESHGAFDVTAGALIKCWGFFKGPRRVPSIAERKDAIDRVGMHHVDLDLDAKTIFIKRAGLEFNLGSIGKGYALDRAAAILRESWNLPSALLHGGHSSVYAIGCEPGSTRGWMVGVSHPWQPEKRMVKLWLRDRALGTSAATFQHLDFQGRKLGHILDPRTGWPVERMASATVVAPTATEADALATAFFVLGPEQAERYVGAHPEITAILLPRDAERPIVIGEESPNIMLEAT